MPSTRSHRRLGAVLAGGGAVLVSVAIGSAFAVTGPAPVPVAHVDAPVPNAPAAETAAAPAADPAADAPAHAPAEVAPVEPAATVPDDSDGPAPAPASEPAPARTVVETNDNEAMVVVDADGQPSASLSATELRDGADEIRLYAYGDVSAGVLTVEVELTNGSAGTIAFPGGVRAQVTVTRDGVAWRTLELSDASIAGLAPGGALTLHATVPGVDGPAAYGFGASVETLQP
jgi:hypothetical protein